MHVSNSNFCCLYNSTFLCRFIATDSNQPQCGSLLCDLSPDEAQNDRNFNKSKDINCKNVDWVLDTPYFRDVLPWIDHRKVPSDHWSGLLLLHHSHKRYFYDQVCARQFKTNKITTSRSRSVSPHCRFDPEEQTSRQDDCTCRVPLHLMLDPNRVYHRYWDRCR